MCASVCFANVSLADAKVRLSKTGISVLKIRMLRRAFPNTGEEVYMLTDDSAIVIARLLLSLVNNMTNLPPNGVTKGKRLMRKTRFVYDCKLYS
jgi:hypothetical protein